MLSSLINLSQYQEHAKNILPKPIYDYYAGGALNQSTLFSNENDITKISIVPKVLRNITNRDYSTNLLSQNINYPIGISPAALQKMAHDDGEIGAAKAAIELGLPFTLSTLSNSSIEEVGQCYENTSYSPWFQLYIHKDRDLTLDLVKRAENAGFSAIVLTVDAPIPGIRELDKMNHFSIPDHLNFGTLSGSIDAKFKGMDLIKYVTKNIAADISFKDVSWLASNTELPIILKGVLDLDDFDVARDYGAKAIIISNHGGRQLDGCISTTNALKQIYHSQTKPNIPFYVDGGFRRGTDILKALVLGAEAVFLARPIIWGLAVNGQQGALEVLSKLVNEFDNAAALAGCNSTQDIKKLKLCFA